MKKMNTLYYLTAAAQLGKTPEEYLKCAKYNYVILEEGDTPLCWSDRSPVVYGTKTEARADMRKGDTLITEQKFLEQFCNKK
jgi:hypothetical protein